MEKTVDRTFLECEEFKLFNVENNGAYYTCIRTEDISNYKIFVKTVQLELLNENHCKIISVNFLEKIYVFWSTNFHMKSLLLVKDIKELLLAVKREFGIKSAKNEVSVNRVIGCNISGNLDFHIEISPQHNAKISIGNREISLSSCFLILLLVHFRTTGVF